MTFVVSPLHQRLLHPLVEIPRPLLHRRPPVTDHLLQVVRGGARPQNQDAVILERPQRLPHAVVVGPVLLREAVEAVDGAAGAGDGVDRGFRGLPVARDDEDGFGLLRQSGLPESLEKVTFLVCRGCVINYNLNFIVGRQGYN